MQSILRADAIFVDMNLPDMTGAHLLCELRRDIVNPYILACSSDGSVQAERRALRLGANGYMTAPVDLELLCDTLEKQLEQRMTGGYEADVYLAETMLQRLFMEQGIPCGLKGYAYLKCAVRLILAGEASADCMQALYEQIGGKYHCTAGSVEKNIRYAISLGRKRAQSGEGRLTGREFITRLLEEYRSPQQTLLKPRVSVFCTGRRVFR